MGLFFQLCQTNISVYLNYYYRYYNIMYSSRTRSSSIGVRNISCIIIRLHDLICTRSLKHYDIH